MFRHLNPALGIQASWMARLLPSQCKEVGLLVIIYSPFPRRFDICLETPCELELHRVCSFRECLQRKQGEVTQKNSDSHHHGHFMGQEIEETETKVLGAMGKEAT